MSPESGDPGGFPPDAQIAIVAEAVLLRAELDQLREERQADFDRLATMWQPTLDDIENANDLQALTINVFTTARIENADDLHVLDEALRLTDQAIALLEAEPSGLTLMVSFSLDRVRHRLSDLESFQELEGPLASLRDVINGRSE